MTSPQENPGLLNDEWIVSYAAGALNEAYALVVASHLTYHPQLQNKLSDAEAIGGGLLNDIQPSVMSEKSLTSVWDKIDQFPQKSIGSDYIPIFPNMPEPLCEYLGKPLNDLKWRMMGPGMKQVKLWNGPDGECLWLLKARGGTKIPSHDHLGSEMTLVLQGSYRAGDHHYTKGSLEYADSEIENHQPIIDQGEDCICLVVTEAPIRLHSLIGRMVQPFIGL